MNRWPQLMKRKTVAEYLDCTEAALVKEVAAGRIPPPVMFAGREHWRKDAIDAAIAGQDAMTQAEREVWDRINGSQAA